MNRKKLKLDTRPLYLLVEERLLDLIEQGYFKPGEKLPSEPVLARELGISRSTLREALRVFEEEGLISRKRGLGTFIEENRPRVIETGLETLESLDSLAQRYGLEAGTKDLKLSLSKADRAIQEKLGVSKNEMVITISRIKTTADRPVAYMFDVLLGKYVDWEDLKANFRGSALDYVLEKKVPVSYARANIIPTNCPRNLARKLRIPPQTPILLLEETLFTRDGEKLGYSLNYFVREFFKFHVIRRPPSGS
ncbi:MAG: GntR family transcriptional regulator [Coprothermobacterota bacterium]|nr:GntR family transcriptional regulator [Coprothermobacterota bacterium]